MIEKTREASDIPAPGKSLMMVSLGCAKNLVDSENMCQSVSEAGIRLVHDPLTADIIVINTCGFIESAKKEAIDKILEMAQYKDTNTRFLIVTGCLAQRYSKEIQQLIPEVDAVLGTAAYDRLIGHDRGAVQENGNHRYSMRRTASCCPYRRIQAVCGIYP